MVVQAAKYILGISDVRGMRYSGFWRKGLAEVKPEGNRAGLGQGGFCICFGFLLGICFGGYWGGGGLAMYTTSVIQYEEEAHFLQTGKGASGFRLSWAQLHWHENRSNPLNRYYTVQWSNPSGRQISLKITM